MQYSAAVSQKTFCSKPQQRHSNEPLRWAGPCSREDHLIEKAQNGDLEAFNELVLAYQDLVYRQALWILKEEEAAEDAVQDTFLKAYRKINTFLRGRPFRSWLLKITTNQCLDMIRKANRHPWLPYERTDPDGNQMDASWIKDPTDTPEQAVEKAEVGQRIAHAIRLLAPEYRTVVILADLQQLDYAEVSAILDVPLGTMKSRLSRARRQLRDALL